MQKIILDTNVLVSAFIQHSYPYLILYHCIFEKRVQVCISDDLFNEYVMVFHRPKFNIYPDFLKRAEYLLFQIEIQAIKYSPSEKVLIIQDKDDNKLLELACEAKADFIITGNTNDFTIKDFRGTKIVSPKEYWENFRA